ncbi:MAG: patatin-like phospholipase family protein [Coriobacteriia bacterium]|nr:patatin-like phospholipase family protein [Coriobacteriia bacterium]
MAKTNPRRRNRPSIGLALGGGAVRGAAHLGVLAVLEDAGIHPDYIAGTSAGAIVGAGYAAGLSVEEMGRLIRNAGWRDITEVAWRKSLSIFDTTPLQQWIASAIGDIEFIDLKTPLAAVACNIIDGRKVIMREGSVVRAAVASAAIPGLFNPLGYKGMLLVDGGLVENLPVETVREMGAEVVIAVDVSPTLRHGMRPDSLRDVVTATMLIAASNTQIDARGDADCLIQPDIEDYMPWDFSKVARIEETGRHAARQALPDILASLG